MLGQEPEDVADDGVHGDWAVWFVMRLLLAWWVGIIFLPIYLPFFLPFFLLIFLLIFLSKGFARFAAMPRCWCTCLAGFVGLAIVGFGWLCWCWRSRWLRRLRGGVGFGRGWGAGWLFRRLGPFAVRWCLGLCRG